MIVLIPLSLYEAVLTGLCASMKCLRWLASAAYSVALVLLAGSLARVLHPTALEGQQGAAGDG